MSMTLDAVLNAHGWAGNAHLSESIDFLARGGHRGGGSRHFFFFGSGGGGSLLFLPILAVAIFGGYLMRNPDKARGLKERLKGAWGAASAGLNSRLDASGTNPNLHPPHNYPYPQAADFTGAGPDGPPSPPLDFPTAPTPQAPTTPIGIPTTQFNAPPGWPVPGGWTPPADWKPDPSWPPAPPGWQFWTSTPAPPPTPPSAAPAASPTAPTTPQRFAAGTTYTGPGPGQRT